MTREYGIGNQGVSRRVEIYFPSFSEAGSVTEGNCFTCTLTNSCLFTRTSELANWVQARQRLIFSGYNNRGFVTTFLMMYSGSYTGRFNVKENQYINEL